MASSHGLIRFSHKVPLNPVGQMQVLELIPSTHTPHMNEIWWRCGESYRYPEWDTEHPRAWSLELENDLKKQTLVVWLDTRASLHWWPRLIPRYRYNGQNIQDILVYRPPSGFPALQYNLSLLNKVNFFFNFRLFKPKTTTTQQWFVFNCSRIVCFLYVRKPHVLFKYLLLLRLGAAATISDKSYQRLCLFFYLWLFGSSINHSSVLASDSCKNQIKAGLGLGAKTVSQF